MERLTASRARALGESLRTLDLTTSATVVALRDRIDALLDSVLQPISQKDIS
jgi:hypothetical protein